MKNWQKLQEVLIVKQDGTSCSFCQTSVQLALRYNKRQNLHFAALQSGSAERLVPQEQAPDPLPNSILFCVNGRFHTESKVL
jgi:predicted DCC family thiol-disulfide oxidoreductase YuxK